MKTALLDRSPTAVSNAPEQLALWVAPVAPPIVNFEPVPDALKLGADRFYLTIRQSGHAWRYPLQLHPSEVGRIAPSIQNWNCSLGLADGKPIDLSQLHFAMEAAIGREAK